MNHSDETTPPQGLEEKLAAPAKPSDTVARCTLKQLRARWGVKLDKSSGEVIHVNGMHRETWKRVGAHRGDDTPYELDRSAP